MKNVLTFPDGCAYDGRVAGDQRPGSEVPLERPKAAMHTASGFFHGLARHIWAAGREEPAGLAGAPSVLPTPASVAHPNRKFGRAVQYRNWSTPIMAASTIGASAPAVFHFNELPVAVIVSDDGGPWFVASDVCAALEIRNSRMALRRLDEDEKGVRKIDTLGGEQEVNIISEPGLYRLIWRSNKPAAREFVRWLAHEVLPAIRKTGHYALTPYTANAGDTLTAEEADLLRSMLRDAVSAIPSTQRAAFMISGWSKLKAHFGVSYRSIPRQEFEEAISIVARHISESTTTESHSVASPPALQHPSFRNRRWLITFDRDGNERATPICPEDFITNLSDLPDQIRDSGFLATADELLAIIKACADRLSDKAAGSNRRSA